MKRTRITLKEPICLKVIVDASDKSNDGTCRSQGGRIVGVGNVGSTVCSVIDTRSGRVRRVSHGSFGSETLVAVDGVENGLNSVRILEEVLRGKPMTISERVAADYQEESSGSLCPIILYTDSNSLVTAIYSVGAVKDIRAGRQRDIAQLRECLDYHEVMQYVFISGLDNPSDCLTKDFASTARSRGRLNELLTTGHYTPIFKD